MPLNLTPERGLIFRIVHVDNVPWILEHGLHCRNSPKQDPNYINIGSRELIDKRSLQPVTIPPGGTLSDYVPFYFTPRSVMLLNIKTGYGNVVRRRNEDIVIFVSSIPRLEELGKRYVFTNRHALSVDREFFSRRDQLNKIDWSILQRSDFKTNDADPGKQVRYQAEALVHRELPVNGLIGLGCYSEAACVRLKSMIDAEGVSISIKPMPLWYF